MNSDALWILIDTETTGYAKPVFAVDFSGVSPRSLTKRLMNEVIAHGLTISVV